MKKLAKVIFLIVSVALTIGAFFVGKNVSGSDQLEIYKMVLTVSSIIFGVMGAWLSLLKADIVLGIEGAQSDADAEAYMRKARDLISPMSSAALTILSCLVFVFLYYSVGKTQFGYDNYIFFRQFSFLIITMLVLWQSYALLKVLASGADFVISLSRKSKDLLADKRRNHIS